jgi:hypothetical protein
MSPAAQVLQLSLKSSEQTANITLDLLQQAASSQATEQEQQHQQHQQVSAGQLPSSSGAAAGGAGTNILPYGSTLHYQGCSCPAGWQPGSRVADQVDKLVSKAHGLYQQGLIAPQRKLRVCYMLPHHNITGGMKCLVEHIRLLRERGHYTIAVHRWACWPLSATRQVQIAAVAVDGSATAAAAVGRHTLLGLNNHQTQLQLFVNPQRQLPASG